MSRRTVTRFALPGLLAATLAAPSQATDVAPMPRAAAKTFKIEFEFRWSSEEEAVPAAPMPRTVRPVSVRPPCCAFDCCQELAAAPMPREARHNIPTLGPLVLAIDLDVPLNKSPHDHRQIVNIAVGVFGDTATVPVAPMPREASRRCCETENHTQLLKLSAEVFATEDSGNARRVVLAPIAPPLPSRCVPAKPANVPPEAFDTLSQTFGEMLNPPLGPAACPTLAPCPVRPAAMSVPAQPTVAPCPLPAACAKTCVTGTWVRELAGMVYVVKVAPDHVTITASSSVELPDGTTHTEGVVVTADYHLTRDGTTVVGLITSVDALIEGSAPFDPEMPPGDDLALLQKSLVDKPLAFTVRQYGDVLAIGNVRLPAVEGARGVAYALSVVGGRYTSNGDKPVPKPRAAKPPVLRDILPVPLTANPPSAYIPPQTGIVQASGTSLPLPPLPRDVSDRLPGVPPSGVTIPPAPPLMPANLSSTPLAPAAAPAKPETAPMPRTAQKPGKKGKKKVAETLSR
ncbi:hypothetical protein [Gemmata sp.]|uniref:hypothetical protein n=1 Tax=Gemmata sp. TaxID=1914242 RepID=UPI003F6EB23E